MLPANPVYERYTNARGEATLAKKINARGEAVYERFASAHDVATLRRASVKALSSPVGGARETQKV